MSDATNNRRQRRRSPIKCVVWDLDETLWQGTLLEGDEVVLRPEILPILTTLDERGILQSIASRNDYSSALAVLGRMNIAKYFLYPQISWNSKAVSLRRIAADLNIGLDSLAFVDDQLSERLEINHDLPEVLTIDSADLRHLLDRPELTPDVFTPDAHLRRTWYRSEIERKSLEESFEGSNEEFLRSLAMKLHIYRATEGDLTRAEELTNRTNQLNTTGLSYSLDELDFFRTSARHVLLMATLEDECGSYGRIALALIERTKGCWTAKLFLVSCRVMSRGIGIVLLNHIARRANEEGVRLLVEFVPNARNRMMHITLRLVGFREVQTGKECILFERLGDALPDSPDYLCIGPEW